MSETPEIFCDGSGSPLAAAGMPELKAWFVREVLPLEANLMQFLRHNWRDHSDIEDILHDVYVRVYEAARRQIPDHAKESWLGLSEQLRARDKWRLCRVSLVGVMRFWGAMQGGRSPTGVARQLQGLRTRVLKPFRK